MVLGSLAPSQRIGFSIACAMCQSKPLGLLRESPGTPESARREAHLFSSGGHGGLPHPLARAQRSHAARPLPGSPAESPATWLTRAPRPRADSPPSGRCRALPSRPYLPIPHDAWLESLPATHRPPSPLTLHEVQTDGLLVHRSVKQSSESGRRNEELVSISKSVRCVTGRYATEKACLRPQDPRFWVEWMVYN